MVDSPLAHGPTLAAPATGSASRETRLEAGVAVGEYVIDRFLGAGAMGEVYAGHHPVIGKRVAIKVLRHELAASAEAAERFIREARAVNQIDHENVIDVFAFGRLDDGRLYLVMDLVEGRSLRAHLVDGPLDPVAALDILAPVAEALDAAHTRGVVHRDLKPDNIVLSNATPPKVFVLDFGIAKLVSKVSEGPAGPGTLTGQGTWLGTPGYMAPEQWSVDGAGPASDRYALGVIAFELLSGALPFSATSVPGMMEQHFRAEVPALSARGAIGVSAACDAVLRKALAKDPDARYPTARALVDALRGALGTGIHRARGAVAAPEPSRRFAVPALAGGAVLAVGLVFVVVTSRSDRPAPRSAASDRGALGDERSAASPDHVRIQIVSTPSGAEVTNGDHLIGTTPTSIQLARGETVELVAHKPGYLAQARTLTAGAEGSSLGFELAAVSRFQGVWRQDNGELRAFERVADQVEVYKLAEVEGARTFYKRYVFAPARHGIVFAASDEVIDPRAPGDPRCHVAVRVEYRYDPESDVLELHREKVKIDLRDGSCVVRSRAIEPSRLARVDVVRDEVELLAPAGKPIAKRPAPAEPPGKKPSKLAGDRVLPLDPKAELDAKRANAAQEARAKQQAEAAQRTSAYTDPEPAKSPPAQAQIAPQPKAPPPPTKSEPPAQQLLQQKK
jgi:tRNA A-37 threonylcarbamoyl transferase component Bud32